MSNFVKVAKVSDLEINQGVEVKLEGRSIAIFKTDSGIFAIDNICPHSGAPLCEGEIEKGGLTVRCPWHAWEFDLKTGLNPDENRIRVDTFLVRSVGDDIEISLKESNNFQN